MRRFWSDAEKAHLRRAYPNGRTQDIAAHLGRSLTSVYATARKLGLSKTQAYLAENCRMRPGEHVVNGHEFKPGHVPANKGLRRPGWHVGRMKETQFKKGQRPPNTLPVGTIQANADGYLRIKVSDDPEAPDAKGAKSPNWEFVHKRVWEAAHGPIPPGHRIWWKDRNHENCALENLELLSDKEHMARTTIHNLPKELKETVQMKGRLKRVIRRKEKRDAEESNTGPKRSPVRNDRRPAGRRKTVGREAGAGRR